MNAEPAQSPWTAISNSWQYTTIYSASGTPICRLDLEDWGVTEDNQPVLEAVQAQTASLLVAAPEMVGRIAELEEVLGDLLSWFDGKPSDPEWRIKAGAYGADDAIQAARDAFLKASQQ